MLVLLSLFNWMCIRQHWESRAALRIKGKFLAVMYACLSCGLWANPSSTTVPTTSALSLLAATANATHRLNYRQTFIYERGSSIVTMRLIQMHIDDHQYEKFIFLNGDERVIVRRDGEIVSERGNQAMPLELPAYATKKFARHSIDEWKRYYAIKKMGTTRIARRPCVEIAIMPKDKQRYGYKIWVDEKSKVLMRFELLSVNNAILERFMVTKFVLNPDLTLKNFVTTKEGTAIVPEKKKPPLQTLNAYQKMDMFVVKWLPNGFTLVKSGFVKSPASGQWARHQLYSDGLASISLYIESAEQRIQTSEATLGALVFFDVAIKNATKKERYYNVTAVGTLPSVVIQRIATSIVSENDRAS